MDQRGYASSMRSVSMALTLQHSQTRPISTRHTLGRSNSWRHDPIASGPGVTKASGVVHRSLLRAREWSVSCSGLVFRRSLSRHTAIAGRGDSTVGAIHLLLRDDQLRLHRIPRKREAHLELKNSRVGISVPAQTSRHSFIIEHRPRMGTPASHSTGIRLRSAKETLTSTITRSPRTASAYLALERASFNSSGLSRIENHGFRAPNATIKLNLVERSHFDASR